MPLIGNMIEVLIDDMITESTYLNEKVEDLEESSTYLRTTRRNLILRSVFGVSSNKFLGLTVSHTGIEASPKKTNAIFYLLWY